VTELGQQPSIGDRLAQGDPSVLGQLLQVLDEAITVRDFGGDLVYANQAALDQLEIASVEELKARGSGSVMAEYLVEDEYGRAVNHNEIPSVRLLRGEPVSPMLIHTIHIPTGRERWSRLKTSPLRDADGSIVAAMTVIEDVTVVKLAELRTQMLAESGRVLASSLDYAQTLRNVVEIAVPQMADFCAVDLVNDLGELERVAAAHRDPTMQALADRLRSLNAGAVRDDHPAMRVMRTGTSELFETISDEQLLAAARDRDHLEMLRELQVRALLIVPMRVPARTIGVMTLGMLGPGRRLDIDDVELAEQLGRRAAVAVENARLHTKLASIADTLQASLLPLELPSVPGWELASLYRPAETDLRTEVGGDFYEFFEHEGVWFAILGDVAGKGVRAASITALMRHGARVASRAEPHPAAILSRLDEALLQQPDVTLCTAVCLSLHPERVVISSAGHPPAIVIAADGSLREAPAPAPLLGAFPGCERTDLTLELKPGDLVVLYTDGVTEALGPDGRFGIDRLRELVSRHAGGEPQALLDHLDRELEAFSLAPRRDDVAALAMRVGGR
jgi:serine phosphatase RsbU (regulator of sigma subunit)